LILDEPVTGLDAVTEGHLNRTLDGLIKRKTSFVIAHRISTARKADLILLIDNGSVIEQGTHAELLASSSLYRTFHELQSESPDVGGEHPGEVDPSG